jgi:5-methylcytosine-specific restriction endonuclease McrA
MTPRPTTAARGYDGPWQRLRASYLRSHPACCARGCTRPATEVDHIRSVRTHPQLRLEPRNLRAMCKPCHSQRTAMDQGKGQRVYGADAAGNPTRPGHPWSPKP